MGQSIWQKKRIEARRKNILERVNKLIDNGMSKTAAVVDVANALGVSTVTVYSDLKEIENDTDTK